MKPIIAITFGIIVFMIFSWIAPLYQHPHVTECGERDFRMTNGVIYCQCQDNVWSKPGKCEDKYK